MSKQEKLINELSEQYAEWLEHAEDGAEGVLIHILASLLIKERNEKNQAKAICKCGVYR